MSKTYEQHVNDIQTWLSTTGAQELSSPSKRNWCMLEMKKSATAMNVYPYFDTTGLNKDFQTEYDNVHGKDGKVGTFTNKPVAYNQSDSDGLDGLSKMFIYRHQGRLKNYRDDIENKNIRTFSALSLALSRYALLKNVNQQ